MKVKTILMSLLIFSMLAPAFSQDAEELLTQGDELYAEMQDMETANEALAKYRAALHVADDKFEVYWRISRILYYIGTHTKEKKEKKVIFSQGIYNANKAVVLEPEKPDGHYWQGVNNGKYGEVRGVLKSLSLVKPIKNAMNKVVELDPAYEDGGADRVLGKVYLALPGFAGGSKEKALEHLQESLEYGPNDPVTRLALAEVYLAMKEKEKAKKELDFVLALDPDPRWVAAIEENKAEAKKMLESKAFKK